MTGLEAVLSMQNSNKLLATNQVIVIYFPFGAILREMAADIFAIFEEGNRDTHGPLF